MAYQQPGQPMYQQQVAQQGGASYNPQQQVVAAAAAAAVQNPWGAAYNPYQQYTTQVSCWQWVGLVKCCNDVDSARTSTGYRHHRCCQ